VAAVATGLVPAASAHATPTPEEVEKQLDDAWNKLEPVIEQYNAVNAQLKANQSKSSDLAKNLEPLQAQVDLAMDRVGLYSAQAYKSGKASALNAILNSDSPEQITDQFAFLEQLAKNQNRQISDVATVRDKYVADKKAADELVTQEQKQVADLAAKKKEIEAQIADLNKVRAQYVAKTTATGLKPTNCPVESGSGAGAKAISVACAQIGDHYIWDYDGPRSFDCSGLTMYAWNAAGVGLPHNAASQKRSVRLISRSELRPGDLVFYFSDVHHVAIYAGGGWVVHAPHAGDHVRMAKMDVVGTINSFGRPG